MFKKILGDDIIMKDVNAHKLPESSHQYILYRNKQIRSKIDDSASSDDLTVQNVEEKAMNLLEVNWKQRSVIINLDSPNHDEVNFIYNFEMVLKSAHQNVTGFTHHLYQSNDNNSLQFRRATNWPRDPDFELYRTHTRIDLLELEQINEALNMERELQEFNFETVLCTLQNHTFFSIFERDIQVYTRLAL